jgi:polyisoprenoid-binding protein YceI
VVQGRVLATAEFPEATFVLTEPVALSTTPAVGEVVTLSATGDLTVHGVTKQVTFELEASWTGEFVDVAGSTPVVFADFGIEAPKTPAVEVDEQGTIELQLTFERASA